MLLEGHRAFAYAAPTTYKRITPKNGCGFILARLAEHDDPRFAGLTKEDIYLGTKWYHRPGFASVLWTALLEDGLIESEDGMAEYDGNYSCFQRRGKKYARANGHYEFGRGWTVRYRLTDKGRRIYEEMMARVNKVLEDKKEFCKRNGIEFGTGKTIHNAVYERDLFADMSKYTDDFLKGALEAAIKYDETIDSKLELSPNSEYWCDECHSNGMWQRMLRDEINKRNAKKDEEVPPGPTEREFNIKQKLDAIINDLMDLRDSLS